MQTIMLKNDGRTAIKIELFCASSWPGSSGARRGLVRLRVDRRWFQAGTKYTFFNADGVALLMGAILAGKGLELAQAPDLPRGSRVRVPNGNAVAGQPLYDKTRTVADPIMGIDGRWYVPVTLFGQGTFHVPVDELGE
ncbi:MAG: hypothetical protein KKE73_09645 [Proteobacteria bacterium]|nr:hypothetical protein [Pseudomonadota bacterium]